MLATVAMLKQEKEQMLKEIARLQEENSCLKNDVQEKTFGFMFLNKGRSDFRTKFYTGLPNYEAFQWLYSLCQNDLPNSEILTAKDVLLLNLMKIRVSEKVITQKSGFLDLLEHGDLTTKARLNEQ